VKNCHGRSASGGDEVGDKGLIEIFELAIETGFQSWVLGGL
jgi:hypothetical protein